MMYNDYFPWWDGQIGISFTREEWECIIDCMSVFVHDRCIGNKGEMERNIIDRIEKNLGVE